MNAPRRVEIARFPGHKRIAVTFSFDDGDIEDRRLIAFMNEYGLRGTFNLNSGTLNQPGRARNEKKIEASEVASLYAGHEVAIHTVSHPRLPGLDASQIATEVLEDRIALEDLVGYPVRGMAYPFGRYSPQVIEVLRALGIVYSRTVEGRDRCFPPSEPLAWPATMHMSSQDPDNVGARFEKLRRNPLANEVFFVWGHSFEFARPVERWADMETLFKPLAGHADVWYCTNIELFDYEAARQRIAIAANRKSAYNPSAIAVTLIVDGKAVDVPPGKVISLI
jgi:peptidoglycan/xylan/chitin deacetylase (PgdA/CDA1 family)